MELDVGLPQLPFRVLARAALVHLAQRAPEHRRQPRQARLADVVGGAVLQQFHRVVLADDAGDEHERRRGRHAVAVREQVRAGEARELVVGEDHVPAGAAQRVEERRFLAHDLQLHLRIRALQLDPQQLGVEPRVLGQQRAQRARIDFRHLTHGAASFAATPAAVR
jgi:hypothetical protein